MYLLLIPRIIVDDTNLLCTGTELRNMIRQIDEDMAQSIPG